MLKGGSSASHLEHKRGAKSVFSQRKNSHTVALSKGVGNSTWETL